MVWPAPQPGRDGVDGHNPIWMSDKSVLVTPSHYWTAVVCSRPCASVAAKQVTDVSCMRAPHPCSVLKCRQSMP